MIGAGWIGAEVAASARERGLEVTVLDPMAVPLERVLGAEVGAIYRERFAGERWRTLVDAGAHQQRPLWASTGTKNPGYSDVLYVEQLIAPDVVNTMPEATLRAFADHGAIRRPMDADARDAEETLRRATAAGIDLPALTAELEREGVRSFCDSCHELLSCIETKLARDELAGARNQSRR